MTPFEDMTTYTEIAIEDIYRRRIRQEFEKFKSTRRWVRLDFSKTRREIEEMRYLARVNRQSSSMKEV